MLTLFFTIIFIAELIIAFWIISIILKCDKAVLDANQKVIALRPVIKSRINDVKMLINTAFLGIDYFAQFIEKKKNAVINALSKNIIIAVLFIVLNTGGKKALTFLDWTLSFVKFMDKYQA